MTLRSLLALGLCTASLIAQQLPTAPAPAARVENGGPPQFGPLLQQIQNDETKPSDAAATFSPRTSFFDFKAPYRTASAGYFSLGSINRAASLVRNNAVYLSLYDAIALAIENNLDVEVARYNLSIAGTRPLRSQGGGNLRPIDLSIAESPTGVGGPGSPLLNSAAASVTPTTPTVNDLTSLNILSPTQQNSSVESAAGYSAGPPLPVLDASLVGQSTFFQRSNSTALAAGALASTPQALDFITANYALVQGFGTGTQLEIDVTNAAQVLYGNQGRLDPFSAPNTSVTLTQPFLRGFGRDVNLRYMKIAKIDQRISRLGFYQQLISTVYGISRLYFDLVSLNENVSVKEQSLTAARKLLENDKAQLEQGTLAPLDVTQAQSLVTSTELDLIQSRGLVRQQEVILKSQLSRRGTADPFLANLPIIPTDSIVIPDADEERPLDTLVKEALTTRPDLAEASLEVESGRISVNASQNQVKPEIDLIANFQTRGSSELPFAVVGTPGTGLITSPADLGVAGLRLSRIYQAGVQLNLPLRNRSAQADAARDLLELRQAQVRTERVANEVREQVENSLIALQTARSAYKAAVESRTYQEQLVQAEQDKLTVGASTNFLVVQQQSYLAQARSSEVAARSVWIKARVALDRSVGDLLQKNNIQFSDSVKGQLR